MGTSVISRARSKVKQLRTVELHDALDVCIRLFLDGACVGTDIVGQFMTPAVLETMISLDVVRPGPAGQAQCAATVMLYPTRGAYIASDRDSNPDSSPFRRQRQGDGKPKLQNRQCIIRLLALRSDGGGSTEY